MQNPEILFKSVKNPTEIANIREAQLKDSVAHVKFMKWIKENYDKEEITELSALRSWMSCVPSRGILSGQV